MYGNSGSLTMTLVNMAKTPMLYFFIQKVQIIYGIPHINLMMKIYIKIVLGWLRKEQRKISSCILKCSRSGPAKFFMGKLRTPPRDRHWAGFRGKSIED